MYATRGSGMVQVRLLSDDRNTRGLLTVATRCAGGDVQVKIRQGRIALRTSPKAEFGLHVDATVNARVLRGTVRSWGPACNATATFTAPHARTTR